MFGDILSSHSDVVQVVGDTVHTFVDTVKIRERGGKAFFYHTYVVCVDFHADTSSVGLLAKFPGVSFGNGNVVYVLKLQLTCSLCRIVVEVFFGDVFQIISVMFDDFHNTVKQACFVVALTIHSVFDGKNDKNIVRVFYIGVPYPFV